MYLIQHLVLAKRLEVEQKKKKKSKEHIDYKEENKSGTCLHNYENKTQKESRWGVLFREKPLKLCFRLVTQSKITKTEQAINTWCYTFVTPVQSKMHNDLFLTGCIHSFQLFSQSVMRKRKKKKSFLQCNICIHCMFCLTRRPKSKLCSFSFILNETHKWKTKNKKNTIKTT